MGTKRFHTMINTESTQAQLYHIDLPPYRRTISGLGKRSATYLKRCFVCGNKYARLIQGMCVDHYWESRRCKCIACGQETMFATYGFCRNCRT